MARNRIFRSVLLAAGVLLMGACASQPASRETLLERKFQVAAKYYQKYQHDGEIWYCKKERPTYSSISGVQCFTESQLRLQVENFERSRNPVQRPMVAGTGQGGIG